MQPLWRLTGNGSRALKELQQDDLIFRSRGRRTVKAGIATANFACCTCSQDKILRGGSGAT